VRSLLFTVLVWSCCNREGAIYCPSVVFLSSGGCYVLFYCGGSLLGRLLCAVLVWTSFCEEAAMYCPFVEVLL